MSKGLYIVFEGIVGSGKSTLSKRLFLHLENAGYPVILTYEPGGSEIANTIRKTVQGTEYHEKMHPLCDAYLYAASRAQTLTTIVKPAVDEGTIVVSDRSLITSLVIQGYVQDLGIDQVLHINKPFLDLILPDLVVYLDIEPEIGLSRTFDHDGDKFEKETVEFYRKQYDSYQKVSKHPMFANMWSNITVDGLSDDAVFELVEQAITPYLINIVSKDEPDHGQPHLPMDQGKID